MDHQPGDRDWQRSALAGMVRPEQNRGDLLERHESHRASSVAPSLHIIDKTHFTWSLSENRNLSTVKLVSPRVRLLKRGSRMPSLSHYTRSVTVGTRIPGGLT